LVGAPKLIAIGAQITRGDCFWFTHTSPCNELAGHAVMREGVKNARIVWHRIVP
jgi:hypothetical protein